MRTTTDAESDAEYDILTTAAGLALLAEVGETPRPGPADLHRWRKAAPAGFVAAAWRLADGRRRGAAKFTRAASMWFEPTALEQATAEPVARHKARRFAGGAVVDLCCGLGGDTLALANVATQVVAVDLDRGMARRALWNAGVHGVSDRVAAVRARAESFALPPGALVHVDPDRRARSTAPRSKALAGYVPGLAFLGELVRSGRGGALKLGPASDFDAHFSAPELGVEIELVSLGGECKEATAWFGPLANCRRRATCLPDGSSWTDRDGPTGQPAPVAGIAAWVYDPDPALVRSGLLDGFATAHGLSRAGSDLDVLTSPARVDSPFLTAFAVDEVLPLDLKRLRRRVAERRLGPLEIKTRGLDLRPEAVRHLLRPEGSEPATLLLLGGHEPSRAIFARRVPPVRPVCS